MKRLQKTIEPKPRPDVPRQLVIAFEAPQLWMMQPPERQRIVSSLANLLMQAAGDDPAAFPLRECNRRKWRPFFGGPGGSRIQGEWPVERRGFRTDRHRERRDPAQSREFHARADSFHTRKSGTEQRPRVFFDCGNHRVAL